MYTNYISSIQKYTASVPTNKTFIYFKLSLLVNKSALCNSQVVLAIFPFFHWFPGLTSSLLLYIIHGNFTRALGYCLLFILFRLFFLSEYCCLLNTVLIVKWFVGGQNKNNQPAVMPKNEKNWKVKNYPCRLSQKIVNIYFLRTRISGKFSM